MRLYKSNYHGYSQATAASKRAHYRIRFDMMQEYTTHVMDLTPSISRLLGLFMEYFETNHLTLQVVLLSDNAAAVRGSHSLSHY